MNRKLPAWIALAIAVVFSTFAASTCFAVGRSSANYTIDAESVDGGGQFQNSVNYSGIGNVGDITGVSASANYVVFHGFIGQFFEGAPTDVMVTVTASPASAGTVSGSGLYPVGSSQSLAATANSGWMFGSWSDGSTENPHTIMVPATNITYTATFATTLNDIGGLTNLVSRLSTSTNPKLTPARKNSLLMNLNLALVAIGRHKTLQACGQLNGFLIRVKVYGQLHILNPTDAAALTAATTAERAALGCR